MKTKYRIHGLLLRWVIKNFRCSLVSSELECLTSPELFVYLPNPTKWCLILYYKGKDTLEIRLKSMNDFDVSLKYLISVSTGYESCLYGALQAIEPGEEIIVNSNEHSRDRDLYKPYENVFNIIATLELPLSMSFFKVDYLLQHDILSMYRQQQLSDFIFEFRGMEFPLHLTLLRIRAPLLYDYFCNDFEQRAFEQFLRDKDVTAESLDIVLGYIYCGNLWTIVTEKQVLLEITEDDDPDSNVNIKDRVKDSCFPILQQVYEMARMFYLENLKAELKPPKIYQALNTTFGCEIKNFSWIINFKELTDNRSPPINLEMRIQDLRLKMVAYMIIDNSNTEIVQFAFQLLSPIPKTDTTVLINIIVEADILEYIPYPQFEGKVCLKPSTEMVPILPTFLTRSFLQENEAKYLLYGELVLDIQLTLPDFTRWTEKSKGKIFNSSTRILNHWTFQKDVLSIMPTPNDIVVVNIGNETIEVSKFILCARSPVFRAMFTTDMIEGNTSRVNIPHIDFKTFGYFVRYVKKGTLPRKTKAINLWLDILKVADMYLLESLASECVEVLTSRLNIRNALKVMNIAHCLNKKDLLFSATESVLKRNSTLRNLRDRFRIREPRNHIQ